MPLKHGLKNNWEQFSLLVLINAFVGGMVGMERTILPIIAEDEFHISAKTAILSFIIAFGISKALANYFTGFFSNKIGRKNLLIIGWLFGLPIPFILMFAPNWHWIVFANILLGINQGLAWSSTIVMKIDLVGDKNKGLAMGLNEFSGYLAVAFVAFLTGWVAAEYGIRPYPFYIGIALSVLGLFGSMLLVRDTKKFVHLEAAKSEKLKLKNIFRQTTFLNKNLSSVTQAGFVNNLNDGMVWGIFPIILAAKNFDLKTIGLITSVYPAAWGIGQLFTGRLSDIFGRKPFLFLGMLLQGVVIILLLFAENFIAYFSLSFLLGIGTALVYPVFLAAIADTAHPEERAESIGVFRLWRDLGYAAGAMLTGLLADFFNLNVSILAIGILTIFSAMVVLLRMKRI